MGFLMMCDNCGRRMRNVPVTQLRNFKEDKIICDDCKKKEASAKKKIDAIVGRLQAEINKMSQDYKKLVADAISESVGEE